MIKVAIFASGNGSNALNIHSYFSEHKSIQIQAVYCNKKTAGIVQKGPEAGLRVIVFNREEFKNGSLSQLLQDSGIDFIILAGFLWLIPQNLLDVYSGRILNIHPALLPSYGGKGMYGQHVHEAVIANKEQKSGITIHEVNAEYDKGRIIFQAETEITENDNAETLAKRIHQLEYQNFPQVIEQWILTYNPA